MQLPSDNYHAKQSRAGFSLATIPATLQRILSRAFGGWHWSSTLSLLLCVLLALASHVLRDSVLPQRSAATPRSPAALPLPLALLSVSTDGPCAFLQGQEAAVFLHVFTAHAWRLILDDTVQALQQSPLRACGTRYFHGLPPTLWPYTGADAAFSSTAPLGSNAAATSDSGPAHEMDTLTALHSYCQAHPKALVSYLHLKGTRFPAEMDITRFARQWDWRKLHLYFLVEAPQGCMRALASGKYDTCGVNKRSSMYWGPNPHYSGNFWWARCSYVKDLPKPYDLPFDQSQGPGVEAFYTPEAWLGKGQPRMFSCFESGVDHYRVEYSRAAYVGATCDKDTPMPDPIP